MLTAKDYMSVCSEKQKKQEQAVKKNEKDNQTKGKQDVKKSEYEDLKGKEKKLQMDKEIEAMKSTHEMDNNQPQKPLKKSVHVKIDEKKCKLYETFDEPTLDEEDDVPD
ncbi:unnamed protein product [Gongylonema pulchrum]|uniref:Protein MNN4-like n=1 Tax=Gongylonema pulchrum TaxID=637853 RepID=A0A183CWC2_9BILA|nr:unnamed protein product [Gongylonema pulchrum]